MTWRTPSRAAVLAATCTVALAGSMGGAGTYALWSDTATVPGTTVSSGSLNLVVTDEGGSTVTGTWSGVDMANLAPGESTAGQLTLTNSGTVGFTVDVTGSATGGLLAHAVVRTVWTGTATVDTTYPRQETCTGGTETRSGLLTAGAQTIASASAGTYSTLIGAGAQRTFCIEISLPGSTPNTAQTATFSPTFTFVATQE